MTGSHEALAGRIDPSLHPSCPAEAVHTQISATRSTSG